MSFTASFLPYGQTGFFSKIVLDYINQEESIQGFYKHPVSIEGVKAAINERKNFDTNRTLLSATLKKQYSGLQTSPSVNHSLESLLSPNTFTVCTAHQPNIFTGHLYFIYKILHTIKLADRLNNEITNSHFVPVYYMGSEDADLEELGHIYVNGDKHEWTTTQTGAVGRMKVDKALVKMLGQVEGQLDVYPYGREILSVMTEFYTEGQSIQQATFQLVNKMFADYGLLIVLPDNADLKRSFKQTIERELMDAFSHTAVEEVISKFPASYKAQASGREINMFYLSDGKRERIEQVNDKWQVVNTELEFSQQELINELNEYPERFSPNVILRPVFQEWILPNIAFIGGGGEIAYWLQLKNVFESANVPYPLLIVRNSFMVVDKKDHLLMKNLRFGFADIFKSELNLMKELVKRDSKLQVTLEKEKAALSSLYDQIKNIASNVDNTLLTHTEALQTQALKKIDSLEKKILRAEKKKFDAEQRQLQKIKTHLFPNNNLQERVENIMPVYAKWGKSFFDAIYQNSLTLEQQFAIISETE
ncbi:MAG: bacillithiol biosynthesis cysteine-adding enzyme BshC [Ferruginibacter sp.]